MIQLYQSWVYTQRDPSQVPIEMPAFTCLITAALTIARLRNQPKCPSTDEWIK
jgi:hypothetical protein